jgi:hypothetical protein
MKRLLALFLLGTSLVQANAEVLTQPTPAEIGLEARALVKDFYRKCKIDFLMNTAFLCSMSALDGRYSFGCEKVVSPEKLFEIVRNSYWLVRFMLPSRLYVTEEEMKNFNITDQKCLNLLQDLNENITLNYLAMLPSLKIVNSPYAQMIYVGARFVRVGIRYEYIKLVLRARKLVQEIEAQEALEKEQYLQEAIIA